MLQQLCEISRCVKKIIQIYGNTIAIYIYHINITSYDNSRQVNSAMTIVIIEETGLGVKYTPESDWSNQIFKAMNILMVSQSISESLRSVSQLVMVMFV